MTRQSTRYVRVYIISQNRVIQLAKKKNCETVKELS